MDGSEGSGAEGADWAGFQVVRWACGPVVRWGGNFAGRLVSYWEIGQVQVFGYDTVGGQVSKVCSIKVTRRTCVGKV